MEAPTTPQTSQSQAIGTSHDPAPHSVLRQAAPSRRTICRLEQLAKGLLLWVECSNANTVVHAIAIGVSNACDVEGFFAARHEIR